jgi:hypothetical protein
MEQRTWVCWKSAHRIVRCATRQCPVHQAVHFWTSHSREFKGALCYNSPDCPVSQRATAIQRQRSTLQSATLSNSSVQKWEQRSQRALDYPVWHRTVQCRKKTKLQRLTPLWTLTVGWRGGAPDKEQCLSGGAPDCPVCPSPAASPTATKVVGDINTPNHHNLWHPSFLKITFNTRALAFTPRHNTKYKILSESQIHSKHLVTCEREIFVFICALVAWIAFLIFPFLFSSAL